MTKQEASKLLITSSKRCNHTGQNEVVYRRRLYPLCKTCFLMAMQAMSIINDKANPFAISKEQEYPSITYLYAYTVRQTDHGYQPEIFHIWNKSTLWVGTHFDTKQQACCETDRYLLKFNRLCTRPDLKRFILHQS